MFEEKDEGIILKEMMITDEKPKRSPNFKVKVSAHVKFDEEVSEENLKNLKERLQNSEVRVVPLRKKTFTKKIYDFNIERVDGKGAKIVFECDGGLNIKRLISGSDSDAGKDFLEITPSMSGIIGMKANCDTFDILDVEVLNE
jgi:tRNA pseudouridine synthase 10